MENPRNTQNKTKEKKSRPKLSLRGKRTITIALALIVFILVAFLVAQFSKKTDFEITKDILKARTYDQVQPGDDLTDSQYVTFDAFFLKDLNGDGIAEQVRGTCNSITGRDTLYMELRVVTDGYLKDGKITINGQNYNLSTSLVKDNEISKNYITTDLHDIDFNDIQNGTQKLLFGVVKTSRDIIGSDTNNYSRIGSAVLTGTHVSSNNVETPINKVVNFQVDWYGTVNAGIETSSSLNRFVYSDLSSLTDTDSLNLRFTVRATESKDELILKSNHTEGTIPQLNGYDPISVKVTGNGITDNDVTYDPTTRKFTVVKNATINGSGIVTNTVNTSSYYNTRYIDYNVSVEYPIEAYESISQENTIEIRIPVSTYNEGYNNPDTTLFDNPYVSDVANATIIATYERRQGTVFDLDVTIGEYVTSPYSKYVISKAKPLRIYNGMSSSESDDNYMVRWYAYTGEGGDTSGLVLSENATNASPKRIDQFIKSDASAEDIKTNLGDSMTANIGIFFSSQETMLGQGGWIKVYNDDTNDLLATFTAANWGLYDSTNPYYYKNNNGDITPIDHIRVETSATNKNSSLVVYNIKQLDDSEITDKYYLDDFSELDYIKTYLVGNLGNMVTLSDTASAHYEAPTSYATLTIEPNVMSTQSTQENDIITITTRTSQFNEQYWINGSFLVKLPNDIIDMKINSVTISDPNVTILGYDVSVDNDGCYWLKILTENTAEATYSITVDADITPDPRIPTKSGTAELYYSNEQAVQYYGSTEDVYDVDGDLNVNEQVGKYSTNISFVSPNSMLTNQVITNYNEKGSISIAPQIADIDKTQRTADIQVNLTNNYSSTTSNIRVLGQIPFIGNKYIYGNTDLGSQFDTQMRSGGITLPSKLEGIATVYYSTEANPTEDVNLSSNHWVTADQVSDWSTIKTYLIDCGSYVFATGEGAQFTYGLSIPEGLDFNDISYSSHIIYFALDTEQGKYYTFTQPAKLGLRIAKQYDLHLNKIQENTTKNLAGLTFSITEKGTNNAYIRNTDSNGNLDITGLYAERTYVIKEIRTSSDYVKIEDEIEFYAYVENPESANNQLIVKYKNNDGTFTDLTTRYNCVTSATTSKQAGEDWKANIQLADEVKSKLKIIKTEGGNLLKNVRFKISGRGKNNVILTTDRNGEINTSGLFLGEEYTLTETRADGYYLIENNITFTISKSGSGFTVNAQGNGLSSYNYTTSDEIPTVVLNIGDEKIPTYGLNLVKYDTNGNTLEGAQFVVKGDGLPTRGTLVTTDANGVATVPTLYEYVETNAGTPKGGIEAEYTIQEVFAPEGYTLDSSEVKIRAKRVGGELQLTVLSGEDRVRTINSGSTPSKDESVLNPSSANPTVVLGFEDKDIFNLKKVDGDNANAPLPGAKFKLYSLDNSGAVIDLAKDVNGNYIGEKDGQRDVTKNLNFTSTSTYPWTQDANHVWYTTNQNKESNTTEMTSENFTLADTGNITFKWTVSSESNYDKVYYTITNVNTNTTVSGTGTSTAMSGTTHGTTAESLTWDNVSFTLPAGTYKIKFTYTKDSSGNTGLDTAYVKDVCIPSQGDDYSIVVDSDDAIKSLNLPYGYYKLVEIEAPENYELPANEADRTHYFGIDTSAAEQLTFTDAWIDTINAPDSTLAHASWNEYNDVIEDNGNNLVTVGSFSNVAEFWNNNKTDSQMIQISAVGSRDAYIAKVDQNGLIADVGNVVGIGDANGSGTIKFEKVIQTQDGGYVAVGSTKSYGLTVYNANGALQNINLDTHGLEDGIIVKFNSSLQLQWVKLVGGNYEEFLYGVAQDINGNIVVVGGANSYTVNLKGVNGSNTLFSTTNANSQIYMEGFVLSLQNDGTYNWVQTIGGNSRTGNVRATGVTTTNGSGIIATACEYGTGTYITSNKGEQDGLIIAFDESGSYLWKKQVGGTQVEIMEGVTNDGAGTLYAYGSYGGDSSYNSTTAQTVKVFKTDNSEEKFDDAGQSAATFTSKGSMDNIILAYQLNGTAEPDTLSKNKSLSFGTNTEDEMSKLTITNDDELVISAWAYGANLMVESNTLHTSHRQEEDAYVLKLAANTDSTSEDNYQVDFFDEIAGVGMDVATAAIETSGGGIVVSGKFGLPAADTATPLDSTKLSGQTKVLKYSNYQDGFLVKYDNYVVMPEIPQLQEITITNYLKQYKITTEVIEHTEKDSEQHDVVTRSGGTVTGQYGTFNDETYPSANYIEFVERVKAENDSLTAIVITPDANYSVTGIKINGEDYTNYTPDPVTGVVTIPVFTEVKENKHIQVQFNKDYSNIEVNHYEWNPTQGKTTNNLAASENNSGAIDSDYTTHPNTEIENYVIVTNRDIYGSNATETQIINSINTEFGKTYTSLSDIGYSSLDEFLNDYYIPDNATGKYKAEKQVINYYYKDRTYTLTVKHYIEGTENQVPKADGTGTVEDEYTEGFKLNDSYMTTSTNLIDSRVYEVVSDSGNTVGVIKGDTTVIYYYNLKDAADLIVHHYIAGTTTRVPSSEAGVDEVADELLPEEGTTKVVGDTYTTNATNKMRSDYRVATNAEVYGDNIPSGLVGTDDYVPDNQNGFYRDETQEVIYYYTKLDPTIDNTISKTGTTAIDSEDDEVSYVITYNATIEDYIGDATVSLVDTLPYEIDESLSSLDGGVYNRSTKTITWRERVNDIDTFTDSTTGTITKTKRITVVYTGLNYALTSFTNEVKGQTTLIDINKSSTEVEDDITTEYGFTKNAYVRKDWDDNNNTLNIRPTSVDVLLKAKTTTNGTDTPEVIPSTVTTEATLSSSNSWSANWSGLKKYNSEGKLITYYFEEVGFTNNLANVYTSSVAKVNATTEFTGNAADDAYVITNKYTTPTEKKNLIVSKVWNDNNNANHKRPTVIKFVVYKSVPGTPTSIDRSTAYDHYTLITASESSHTFEVDKYDQYGYENNYEVVEQEVSTDDLKFYTTSGGTVTQTPTNNAFAATITNTFTVPEEEVRVKITKVWDDNSNSYNQRPSKVKFVVNKVANGQETRVTDYTLTVSANSEEITIPGLAKYDEHGNEIVYTVREEEVNTDDLKYYSSTSTNLVESSEVDSTSGKTIKVLSTTMTNRFEPDLYKISINVKKIWDDNNNANNKRPASVTFNLKNGNTVVGYKVLNAANNWSDTFTDLAKYDDQNREITYTVEEVETNTDDLKFYSRGTTTGSIANGFEITNTFRVPDDKIQIPVTKTWTDNSNATNDRPSSIIFKLTGNNQEYTHELTRTNNQSPTDANTWEYTFENLPKYDSTGSEITYVLTEQAATVGDLASYKEEKTSDYVINNTQLLKDIDVTKTGTYRISSFNDIIDYDIKYRAKIDNDYNQNVTLTLVDNLPYNIDTTESYDLAGGIYNDANKTITWTGTYNFTTNKITWSDNTTTNVGNSETSASGQAFIIDDGTDNIIGFNKAITFKYKDLPLSISKITNSTTGTVQLIAGNPMTDTDTHDTNVIFKTEVKVRKVWQGDSDSVAARPAVTLYVNTEGANGTLTPVAQATITSSYVDPQDENTWVYTFEDLPKYDSVTREEINYIVTEDPVPAGYYIEYGKDDEGRQLVINSKTGSIAVSNTIVKTGTATLTTESDQINYSIAYNATVTDYMGTATVTIVDTLPYTIDVSKSNINGGTYNADNKTITWTQNVAGINTFEDATTGNISINKQLTLVYNDVNFGLDSFTNTVRGQTLLNKTNIRSEEVTDTAVTQYGFTKDVTATKEWVGKSKDSVTFNLNAYTLNGGQHVEEVIPSTVQTRVTIGAADNWTNSWRGLAKYNSQGKLIYYYVTEDVPLNYTMTSTETESGNTTTFAFKNTYNPVDKQITVQKVWNDNNNENRKRPAQVDIVVYKLDGRGNPIRTAIIAQDTLVTARENSLTFNLQKFEDSGEEIFYYAEEKESYDGDLKFYTSQSNVSGNNITITNTFNVPDDKAKIVINKTWNDNSNVNNERPTSITFNIQKVNGTNIVNVETKQVQVTGDTQTVEVTGLPKYDEHGNEIVYLVNEDQVTYYTTTISALTESSEVDATTNKPVKVLTTNVTNTFDPDSVKIDIKAKKIWDDDNNSRNKRPSSVIIKLMNGSTEVASQIANSTGNWTVTFNNLPKYDSTGNPYRYTIDEQAAQTDDLKFYTAGAVTGDIEQGFEITNTFTVPDEKISISTKKVWNDNSNQLNERPESVIFLLTGDNQVYTQQLNVTNVDPTNADNWIYTFEELPKYDANGDEIEYVLTEQAANLGDLADYKKEKTGDYVITNSLILKEIDVEKDGTTAISSLDDTVTYNLQYKTKIDNQYQDAVTLTMIDTLPYAIDTEKSYDLAGGVYDSANRTITWTGELDYTTNKITWSDGRTTNLLNEETTENGKAYLVAQGTDNLIGFNKTVTLVYKDLPLSTTTLTNNVLGRVELNTGAKKEDRDVHETDVNFVVDVKVMKTWMADSDSTEGRTNVVLAVNAKAEDGTLTKVSEATLSDAIVDPDDSNSWIYVFNGLPKYDSVTRKEVEYVVTEENVPTGYFVGYNKLSDGTLVAINYKLGSITLTKVDKIDDTIKIGGAEFKIEKLKKDGNSWVVDNSFVSQTATSSTEESTLGQFKFSNLEYGKYRITETKSSDGYNLSMSPMEVEIDVDNKDYVGNFADIKSAILPEAGGKIAIYSVIVVAIIAAGIVIYKKKFADNK